MSSHLQMSEYPLRHAALFLNKDENNICIHTKIIIIIKYTVVIQNQEKGEYEVYKHMRNWKNKRVLNDLHYEV